MNPIDASLRAATLATPLSADTPEDGVAARGTPSSASTSPSAPTSPVGRMLASVTGPAPDTTPTDPSAALPPPAGDALSPTAMQDLQHALAAGTDTATLHVDVTQLLALMTKFAQEMRTARSQDRTAALNTQMLSLSQSADEIRESAAKNYAATVLQGAVQIGGGVLQGGGAMMSLGSTKMSVAAGLETGEGQTLGARAATQQAMGKALGEGVSGTGTIAAGGLVQEAKNHDADQARDEAQAKRGEANAGAAGDAVSKMDQVIASLRDMGRTMNQAHSDTAAAVIRNV